MGTVRTVMGKVGPQENVDGAAMREMLELSCRTAAAHLASPCTSTALELAVNSATVGAGGDETV